MSNAMRKAARALSMLLLAGAAGGEPPAPFQGSVDGTAPEVATPATGPDDVPAATEPEPPRWRGTFAEGLDELRRLAEEGHPNEALALSRALLEPTALGRARASLERRTRGVSERAFAALERPLEWLGFETRTAADRAEVHYATGLVQARGSAVQSAADSFDLARELAGPGDLRLDAMYCRASLDLALAEEVRARIPEISGAPAVPATGAPPAPPLPGAKDEADPLDLARAAYRKAREGFVERLRADWRDADSRANMELVMRRLAELDEIEREREEQQQDQQQEPQQEPQPQQSPEQDPGGEGEEQPQDEQQPEPSEEPAEPQDSEEEQDSESAAEEGELTKEQVKRLLDMLREHDERGERMREALRRVRRTRVERDW